MEYTQMKTPSLRRVGLLTTGILATAALALTATPAMAATDSTKPVVEYVGGTLFGPNSNEFSIKATDNVGVTKIVANIYSGSTLLKSNQVSIDGGAESSDFTVNVSAIPNGAYSVKFNALDAAGNLAQTKTQALTIDRVGPTVTVKPESKGSGSLFSNVSFKLNDANKVDKLTLNGVVKDLTDNVWSDLNGVKPGQFGAVEGLNTLVVYDVAGNATTVTFTLDTTGPTITVKPESQSSNGIYRTVSFKLYDANKVAGLTLNGVAKDLTDNVWSDLNGVVPGAFGAVEGVNTLVVSDVLGNTTTLTFNLDARVAVPADDAIVTWWDTTTNNRSWAQATYLESVNVTEQGWVATDSTKTVWKKAYYNTKPATVTATDAAGNVLVQTFTPASAPVPVG